MNHHRATKLTLALLGLAVVLSVYALGCKKDKTTNPTGGGGPADVTIQIVGFNGANSYAPDTATVAKGQTVSWHNADATAHTATANNGTAFGTGTLAPGATSAAAAMNTAGTFPYHCLIHGTTMSGVLIVTP
ncbi:MAG TPA: cupredoxin domain-containing protein [Candidatus Binatia bacterium]|nr:cupredoxin domain-containing protein [Candidatus Binatia bacterium]